MTTSQQEYPARLEVDYTEQLDRITTFFRLIWIIPIMLIWGALSSTATSTTKVINDSGELLSEVTSTGGGIAGGLFFATMLMIVFREKYPRWWFDFAREFARFGARVGSYFALLTDRYPSTTDEQMVHLEIDYPDVQQDLNRWMPLVKWFLAIPHYIVLAVLMVAALLVILIAWFAILFTGRYPRGLFDYVVGVARYALRVQAYVSLLVTDRYPPFSLS